MLGNTFLVCVAPFHTWKITKANKITLSQFDFGPFASQSYLLSNWLCMVQWCNEKKARSGLMCITIHFRPTSFVNAHHHSHGYRPTNLVVLHVGRRHDTSVLALSYGYKPTNLVVLHVGQRHDTGVQALSVS